MRFAVYAALCEEKRLYIGQTKLWRVTTRWSEHADPANRTTRWTSKYPVLEKLAVYECATYQDSVDLEHRLCEGLMAEFGLDAVRGGGWNMLAQGPDSRWWVPPALRGTPDFTTSWRDLSGRKYAACVRSALARLADRSPLESFPHSRSSLKRA